MSSRRSGEGSEGLYQSSLFRYSKPKPRSSAPAAPREGGSSFKDQTSPTTKAGTSTKPGVTRGHASSSTHPIASSPTLVFGGNSSRPSRDVKENKAPTTGALLDFPSSSPGLSPSEDQRIIQREKSKAVERDHEDAAVQAAAPGFSKRKARGWEFEEHSRRIDGEVTKRRRRTSSSLSPPHNQASGNIIKEEITRTLIRRDPQSTPTKTPHTWCSAVTPFHDDDYDIDAGFGSVIESSQTQPLLSPERPLASSLPAHTSSSQASDGGIVRSSQSPSPLKYSQKSIVVVEEPTFIVTPIKASTYPSPSKIGLDVTETPVARRRRAPEPGTISLFGVKGAGVISPPEVPLDIESPSTRALRFGVKLIRRPGRCFMVDDQAPKSSPRALNSKQTHNSPVHTQAQLPSVPSIAPIDEISSQTPAHDLGGSSENVQNEASETGPFWETQPLLNFDSDEPISLSTSSPVSPSPLPLPSTGTSLAEIRAGLADTSGSETEPDSPTPFLPSTRYNTSSIDPDKTIVTFTPTRRKRGDALGPGTSSNMHSRHLDAGGNILVVGTDLPTDSVEGEGKGVDMTMANNRKRALGYPIPLTGELKEGAIRDVTLGLEGLSPFKREKMHAVAHKQVLHLHESEAIVIDDEEGDDSAGPVVSRHAMPPEETQDDQTYTQLWPGTSLPAGWNAFETPKKPRREPGLRFPKRNQSNSCSDITSTGGGCDGDDLVWGGHASGDAFGPEVTPGTLQREKPDEVKAFEALPSPYAGMFGGHVEGESEGEDEV